MRFWNKRGSSAVFLCMILVTMVGLCFVLIEATKQATRTSEVDAVLRLSARSVLAEYDRRIYDEYGLFAFYGMESDVSEKIKDYANVGLDMAVSEVRTDLADYCFADVGNFGEAVQAAAPVDLYVFSRFRHEKSEDCGHETSYDCEVEYIIYGLDTDKKNKLAFKAEFLALRELLNSAHIYSDPEKNEATLAMAEALSVGLAAPIAQAAIVAIWAGFESANDWKLIDAGKKVPLIKTEESWATSLNLAMSGGTGGSYIDPGTRTGEDYEAYLRYFLLQLGKEKKLMRIMSCMERNLREHYYPDFSIRTYSTGFRYQACVAGKTYTYYEKY